MSRSSVVFLLSSPRRCYHFWTILAQNGTYETAWEREGYDNYLTRAWRYNCLLPLTTDTLATFHNAPAARATPPFSLTSV